MESERKKIGKYCPKCNKGFSVHWIRCYYCDGRLVDIFGTTNDKQLLDPVKPEALKTLIKKGEV